MKQEPALQVLQKQIFGCTVFQKKKKKRSPLFHQMIIDIFFYKCRFKNAWAEVDPRGTGYIQKEHLGKLLRLLGGRFKFRIYEDEHDLHHLLELSKMGTSQQVVSNPSTSPAMEEKSAYSSGFPVDYNFAQVNWSLNTMNAQVTRQRRFEYNICVKVSRVLEEEEEEEEEENSNNKRPVLCRK
jgi:hypothetical protein